MQEQEATAINVEANSGVLPVQQQLREMRAEIAALKREQALTGNATGPAQQPPAAAVMTGQLAVQQQQNQQQGKQVLSVAAMPWPGQFRKPEANREPDQAQQVAPRHAVPLSWRPPPQHAAGEPYGQLHRPLSPQVWQIGPPHGAVQHFTAARQWTHQVEHASMNQTPPHYPPWYGS